MCVEFAQWDLKTVWVLHRAELDLPTARQSDDRLNRSSASEVAVRVLREAVRSVGFCHGGVVWYGHVVLLSIVVLGIDREVRPDADWGRPRRLGVM